MKKMILCLITCLILSFNAFSQEVVLTVTDNDDNNEIYKLVVLVNEETQTLVELYKDTYIGSNKISRKVLDSQDLSKKSGMILEERKGHNVLNLKSDNFDHDLGGRIIIDTLYSGISGDRKQYEVDLAKDNDGWKLFNKQKIITKFHVKVNRKIIVGAIGIKTLTME